MANSLNVNYYSECGRGDMAGGGWGGWGWGGVHPEAVTVCLLSVFSLLL